jgi:hypothetical protein
LVWTRFGATGWSGDSMIARAILTGSPIATAPVGRESPDLPDRCVGIPG